MYNNRAGRFPLLQLAAVSSPSRQPVQHHFSRMFSATGRCASVAYCIAVGGLWIAAGPAFFLLFPVIGSEPNRALERDDSSKHHPVFADRVLDTLAEPTHRWAYFPMTFSALCHSLRDSVKSLCWPDGGLCWVTNHLSAVMRRSHLMVARFDPGWSAMKI